MPGNNPDLTPDLIRRYVNVRRRAAESPNEHERATAQRIAEKMEADHPGLRDAVDQAGKTAKRKKAVSRAMGEERADRVEEVLERPSRGFRDRLIKAAVNWAADKVAEAVEAELGVDVQVEDLIESIFGETTTNKNTSEEASMASDKKGKNNKRKSDDPAEQILHWFETSEELDAELVDEDRVAFAFEVTSEDMALFQSHPEAFVEILAQVFQDTLEDDGLDEDEDEGNEDEDEDDEN